MTKQTEWPRVGVGMIVYNDRNQILMGKRLSQYGYGTWNNPGGKVEFGEDCLVAAARETKEETNLSVWHIYSHGYFNDKEIYDDETERHWVTLMFSGYALYPEHLLNLEPTKHSQWNWFTVGQWPEDMWEPMRLWWNTAEGKKLKEIISAKDKYRKSVEKWDNFANKFPRFIRERFLY